MQRDSVQRKSSICIFCAHTWLNNQWTTSPLKIGLDVMQSHPLSRMQHTLTGRYTSRPHSCSLTSASTVSHQVIACITAVSGCLSKCCSSRVTKLTIDWTSQIATVHNCQMQIYTHIHTYTCTSCTLLDTATWDYMYSACVLYGIGHSCFKPKATNSIAFLTYHVGQHILCLRGKGITKNGKGEK